MTRLLKLLFVLILLSMLAVTGWASLQEGVLAATARLLHDRWAVATLFDAYFGFTTFFVWVAYKEKTLAARAAWFVLIMVLGNIAMAAYMLLELHRLKPGEGPEQLLLRRA